MSPAVSINGPAVTSPMVSNAQPDPVLAALDTLREAAQELTGFPTRLHLADVQPKDLLGAPRWHPAFLSWLDAGIHDSRPVRIIEHCRRDHPIDGPTCAWCGGHGSYPIIRQEYVWPFSRALWISARRGSNLRPHPVAVVMALIRAGFDPIVAADLWGERVMSADHLRTVEARCVSAIRSVMNQCERTVLPEAQRSVGVAIGA